MDRNLGIRTLPIEEDSAPVSETWEEGAAADSVLILLDGICAPPPLRREAWEGLIDHDGKPPIAFARLEDCAYPKLLERRTFFPANDVVALERAVERWMTAKLPEVPGIAPAAFPGTVPDEWWTRLVDETGGQILTQDAAAAHAFAHQAAGHFQAVVWVGCAGREAALIRAEVEPRVRDGRVLAVLAHIDKPLKIPETRSSYLQVLGTPPEVEGDAALGACYAPRFPGWLARELGGDLSQAALLDAGSGLYRLPQAPRTNDEMRQRHLTILHRYFQFWKGKPEPCRDLLAEVPAAIQFGFDRDWVRGAELCRRAAFLLLAEGRRREGIRMFHRLLVEAEEHHDPDTAADARHELSWLTDEDGPVRAAATNGQQLSFDLSVPAKGREGGFEL
ncbi:MAG: hypothetical protein ACKV2U_30315 [Bryobacteraceae bacterium]